MRIHSFDSIRDARGMAIKLQAVPGTQLMPSQQGRNEQDFVMFNRPNFFVSDVASTGKTLAHRPTARSHGVFSFMEPEGMASSPPVHCPGHTGTGSGQRRLKPLLFGIALQIWQRERQVPRSARS